MCIPILQRSLGATVGDSRADRRLQRGAAGPEPTTGLPEWPGLGRTSAGGRAPHRACAAPRAPRGSRGRGGASSRPSRLSLPIRPGSASTACPSVPCLGGRPPLPGTHRYQHGGFPMLLRLRPAATAASTSAHLPAVGQRRHQPTGAGTRQWRLGRRVGARGRARSDRRGNVAKARGFTVGLSWDLDSLSSEGS